MDDQSLSQSDTDVSEYVLPLSPVLPAPELRDVASPTCVRAWCFTLNRSADIPSCELARFCYVHSTGQRAEDGGEPRVGDPGFVVSGTGYPNKVEEGCKSGVIQYICAQGERGESGNLHWQGYVRFRHVVRLGRAKSLLHSPTVHLEPRRGSEDQAIAYTRKEGAVSPWFFVGKKAPGRGARTDLTDLKEAIKNLSPWSTLIDEHFGSVLRYCSGITRLRLAAIPPRNWVADVRFISGPPGIGKTRTVMDSAPLDSIYITQFIKGQPVWFEGYDPIQHTTVLIDDFFSDAPYRWLLRLLDRYPMWVPVKGGAVQFTPKVVYITSNSPLSELYPNITQHRYALYRRFSSIVEYQGETPVDRTEYYHSLTTL